MGCENVACSLQVSKRSIESCNICIPSAHLRDLQKRFTKKKTTTKFIRHIQHHLSANGFNIFISSIQTKFTSPGDDVNRFLDDVGMISEDAHSLQMRSCNSFRVCGCTMHTLFLSGLCSRVMIYSPKESLSF